MKLSPADEQILKYLRRQVDRLQDERYRTDARPSINNEILERADLTSGRSGRAKFFVQILLREFFGLVFKETSSLVRDVIIPDTFKEWFPTLQ